MAKVPSDTLTINVEEVLRFFDEKPKWSRGHATGVVGVVGEDLNAACFRHYAESQGAKVCVKECSVTPGTSKGPRLDRWIVVDWLDNRGRIVYQTEIKNWSAHAIGGRVLCVGATPEQVANYKQVGWDREWDSQNRVLKRDMVAKVLVQMKRPDGVRVKEVRPLLIFWEAIGPRDRADEHLFSVASPTCCPPVASLEAWPELWVFSVSSYLRSILAYNIAKLSLPMPNTAARLRILAGLLSAGR